MSQQQRLVLRLFGPPELMLDGSPATGFDSDKVRALLVYLALETDRPHRRERLAGLLWPDYPERSARTSLRSALANLRQVIGDRDADPPFLHITRQTIQFNAGSATWIDVLAFLNLTLDAQVDHLQEATALYRGDFLEGFTLSDSAPFEEWALLQRQALTSQAINMLRQLATLLETSGAYQRAIPYARRQIDLDPFREEGHRQLMRLLALNGQTNEALGQYQVCKQLLSNELGVQPAAETTALYERIQRGDFEPSDSLMPLQPVRGYELRDFIGSGHFGAVYRAFQPVIDRDVAVKIILPQYADDPSFIRRFEAEAQTVARLEHPHIVPLYDYWREPGEAYLVMRWLRGGSLQTALARGPWNGEPALQLLDQIAAALAAAHRQGIIHRDIKPANILLDEESNAYLSDFGIATLTGPGATASEARLIDSEDSSGSLGYLSPETARGETITTSADIYSLGVVLYELLTARSPFPDVHGQELIDKHLYEPLPEVTILRPDLPESVNNVIHKATAKNPQDRYAGALELAVAFRQALEPGTTPLPAITGVIPNPYKGLRPFQEADAADFFGREELVSDLLAAMEASSKEGKAPFLALVGPSGSGKSSVVKAGLIPALRRGALSGSEDWYIVELAPGSHPLEELETALLRIAVNPPESLLGQLQEDSRGLLRAVKRALPDDSCRLLLVIDQFEELFTLVNSEEERAHFLNSIATALAEADSPLQVILTLRADFYDRPLLYPAFNELMRGNTQVILPLTPQELQRAIAEPAERAGVSLEPGLVAEMVDSVSGQPGGLPLLQFALTELFENRQEDTMTLKTYRASGGVDGALSQRAEKLYDGMDAAERENTRQLFLRLVTLGEGVEDTRRRVLRSELESIGKQPAVNTNQGWREKSGVNNPQSIISTIIDTFGQARLLTFDRDHETREPTVEIAHEALLSAWDRLGVWLRDGRDEIRLERRLAAAAEEWQNAERGDSYLLQGARLALFEEWAANSDIALTTLEEEYLAASVTAREARHAEEEARRQRELEAERQRAEEQAQNAARLRRRALYLVGVALIALILAGAALLFANRAETEAQARATAEAIAMQDRDLAQAQRLAAEANSLMLNNGDSNLIALLTIQSLNLLYTPSGDAMLASLTSMGAPPRELRGHAAQVWGLDFSSDGKYLVTVSKDRTARLWDIDTGETIRTFQGQTGEDVRFGDAVFSPDGRYLLTSGGNEEGDQDNTARLWDVTSGQLVRVFAADGAGIDGTAFSPDGKTIATAGGADQTARIWDIATGQTLHVLTGHSIYVPRVVFSPDGKYVLTASLDRTARLWDVASGREVRIFSGHTDAVGAVDFSPDGQYIATASDDGTARIWDVKNGQVLHEFAVNEGFVGCVKFSPDGRFLLTGSESAQLWDVNTGERIRSFTGHIDGVREVAFSPDGRLVGTAAGDGLARVWNLQNSPTGIQLTGHRAPVKQALFSPDGKRVVTASDDGTVHIWDASTGKTLITLSGHPGKLNSAVFSKDGKLVLTASNDGTVRIWDVASGEELQRFEGHTDIVFRAIFSPDGKYVVSTGWDGTARVWDAQTARIVAIYNKQGPGHVNRVAFSPDGKTVVTSGDDGTARIWDPLTGEEKMVFEGHTDSVTGVAFSPDGTHLVTASGDGTVRLWEAASGTEVRRFGGLQSGANGVAFSPDGKTVLAGGKDGTARLWDVQTGEELRRFIGHTNLVRDVAFSPDGKYILTASEDSTARLWLTDYHDTIRAVCALLTRDLTPEERVQFNLSDQEPTCPEQLARNL